jgi:hypothetical protein
VTGDVTFEPDRRMGIAPDRVDLPCAIAEQHQHPPRVSLANRNVIAVVLLGVEIVLPTSEPSSVR